VIVGASSGLGRTIGVSLAERGHQVALLARRKDRLDEAVAEAGNGAIAISCDVTDEASCQSAISQAASGLGGIDSVLYASGIGPLHRIEDISAATWRASFDTNVIGASLITAAALPHLAASGGVAAYMSTVSASLTAPWPGLAAYAVTKAALERLIEAWRAEHPEVGFTRIVVGECAGGQGPGQTEFNIGWDFELAGDLFPIWMERGLMSGAMLDVAELVKVVDAVTRVGASASIQSVAITPRVSTATRAEFQAAVAERDGA
jgi:NAD(P)-dependent dehydrogenase (short-subunit alcohol dehydrogenase family)